LRIVQVVKRFGMCGGMEEYAYRLTCELSKLGVKVHVVCEEKVSEPEVGTIEIVQLGKSLRKPRWLSHIIFAKKVGNWAIMNTEKDTIIHSHERINCHHVTTIHSTLYNFPPKRKFPSLRNYFNEFIEKRELSCASVEKIVPVSALISDQIATKHSSGIPKLVPAIPPGISPINAIKKEFDPNSPVIGFMGREWKRKGLPKVIEIWRELRKKFPFARLCLAGFPIDEPIGIFEDEHGFIDILGHVGRKEVFYEKIDILVHPAKREAYGMVIAEALSAGVPVLCSSECGASVHAPKGTCCTLSSEIQTELWTQCLKEILEKPHLGQLPPFSRPWENVAQDYLRVYKAVST
jgi:UDP-glucose:(heptosyl)LPS alpha-1,3-glucosyltransferase